MYLGQGKIILLLFCFFGLLTTYDAVAQFGNRNLNGQRAGFGRQGSIVPDTQAPSSDTTPPTAQEMVDEQMPSITEALELDPFEEAVVRTSLIRSVQQRMELQILALEPLKMKEEMEKIKKRQDEEIKAGLPPDKYDAYLELQENKFKDKKEEKEEKEKDIKKEAYASFLLYCILFCPFSFFPFLPHFP